jgi:hypothetical protein
MGGEVRRKGETEMAKVPRLGISRNVAAQVLVRLEEQGWAPSRVAGTTVQKRTVNAMYDFVVRCCCKLRHMARFLYNEQVNGLVEEHGTLAHSVAVAGTGEQVCGFLDLAIFWTQ